MDRYNSGITLDIFPVRHPPSLHHHFLPDIPAKPDLDPARATSVRNRTRSGVEKSGMIIDTVRNLPVRYLPV